jgi:dTDP-4-amino-4,6-dideoxygalactose transaminase
LPTYNIDPSNIAKFINKNTKAIITVHLYGLACDMSPILKIARESGIFVIEDAAQAHGSEYFNKKIGSLGDIAAFSFYPGKNLGSIDDAGAIVTNNEHLAHRIRKLRNYGSSIKYIHTELGFNARASELSCAMLYIKLQDLDNIISRKNKLARLYEEKITSEFIKLPFIPDNYKHSWHQYVVAIDDRDKFVSYLAFKGIQTLIHYPVPPMRSVAYQKAFEKSSINNADYICQKVVSLPIDPFLETSEIDFISMVIDDYFNNKN